MHPVLFEIFGYQMRTYGFAMAMAFVVNILLAQKRAPIEKLDREITVNTCLWVVIGTLVGGRVLFGFTLWSEFAADPKKLVSFWEGGLVFYGGFIGSYIAAIGYLLWVNLDAKSQRKFWMSLLGLSLVFGYLLSIYRAIETGGGFQGFLKWLMFWNYPLHLCAGFLIAFTIVIIYFNRTVMKGVERRHRLLPTLDLLSPYVGLGLAIHRGFGCFMNGCCYGRPTDLPIGVQFPLNHAGTKFYGIGAHLHPSQLYESANGLIIFFALLWFRKHKKANGEVTAWLLMIYAFNRYIIEYFRGDKLRGTVSEGIPMWSFVLMFLAVTAALFALLYWVRKRGIDKNLAPADNAPKVFGTFFAGMAFLLFVTVFGELFRLDPSLSRLGPLSTSQFIGYLTFIAGFMIYVITHYWGKRVTPAK